MPSSGTCCASVGFPTKYCPGGLACNSDGTCGSSRTPGSSSGSGSGSSGSGSSGSSGSSTQQCSPASSLNTSCDDVRACCDASGGGVDCWYLADGKRFDCNGTCSGSDAQAVVDYCDKSAPGCSTAKSSGKAASGVGWVGAMGLAFVGLSAVRRRRRGAGSPSGHP